MLNIIFTEYKAVFPESAPIFAALKKLMKEGKPFATDQYRTQLGYDQIDEPEKKPGDAEGEKAVNKETEGQKVFEVVRLAVADMLITDVSA